MLISCIFGKNLKVDYNRVPALFSVVLNVKWNIRVFVRVRIVSVWNSLFGKGGFSFF